MSKYIRGSFHCPAIIFKGAWPLLQIKALNNLENSVIDEIRKAEELCRKHDNHAGSISLDSSFNFRQDLKSVFLLYDQHILVSVLSIFAPTRQEAEVSAFTIPASRQKGYFNILLEEATAEIKRCGVKDILFVCEPSTLSGREVLKKLNARYDFTEYSMKYFETPLSPTVKSSVQGIMIKASTENIDEIVELRQKIFADCFDDAMAIAGNTFGSDKRDQYIFSLSDQHVGIVSVFVEEAEASIHGFGIIPEYQGKGLGKEMLLQITKNLISEGYKDIIIEVDSKNQAAFELYKKCGFKVTVSYDYYRYTIAVLGDC
jgi:ribosomal protein S18 acetylase RimI-like enzyme